MSTYDKRLGAVETDMATMKQDIIYKLDDTNSAVGILRGIIGNQGRDIKLLINQTKAIDLHLDSLDLRLDSVDLHLETVEKRLTSLEQGVNNRFETVEKRLTSLEQGVNTVKVNVEEQGKKLDQVLVILSKLTSETQSEA